jgi:hypothetical protein
MKSGRFCLTLKYFIVESSVCCFSAFCYYMLCYIFAALSTESKQEFYAPADFNVWILVSFYINIRKDRSDLKVNSIYFNGIKIRYPLLK